MNWLDSHCHINDKAFKEDLDDVLQNMVDNDVRKAMLISSYIDDYEYGFSISHPEIELKHSLGIYPGDVDDVSEELFEEFARRFREDRCQAIGEIGLDYYWDKHNKQRQIEIFKRQLLLAKELVEGVMHCYSNSAEMAREFVKLGYYISISGTITWKNAREPLEVVKAVPLNRLLIETDCPYLTPAPNRGKRNEPAYVVYTGRKICEVLGIDEEDFKKQLNENYHRLFRL